MVQQKFIADAMMGEVARWLRLMGYDVLYNRNYTDYQIMRIAEKTGRIIITRDRGLHYRARKAGLRSVFVASDDTVSRLAEVAYYTGIRLKADPDTSRCPACNGVLEKVDREKVKGRVPPGAYEAYDTFYVCTSCGTVYWRGSHWRNIERIVKEARSMVIDAKRRVRSRKGDRSAR